MIKLVNQQTKQWLYAPIGFSWTNFFFGPYVPLYRGEAGTFWVYAILGFFTFGIYNIFMWFNYNKNYIVRKIQQGWIPASESDKSILLASGIATSQVYDESNDEKELTFFKPNRLGFYIMVVLAVFFGINMAVVMGQMLSTI